MEFLESSLNSKPNSKHFTQKLTEPFMLNFGTLVNFAHASPVYAAALVYIGSRYSGFRPVSSGLFLSGISIVGFLAFTGFIFALEKSERKTNTSAPFFGTGFTFFFGGLYILILNGVFWTSLLTIPMIESSFKRLFDF